VVQLSQLVAVLTNHDGEPVSFNWQGLNWLVSSVPVRWYSRKTWWADAESAPRGAGAALVEVEIWRLRAASTGGTGFFELRREAADWQLYRVD
jgi:hypothetical protein